MKRRQPQSLDLPKQPSPPQYFREEEKEIFLNITYPYPIHTMKAYKSISNHTQKLTNTEKYSKEIFSLPIYPELKLSDAKKLVSMLIRKLNEK